MEAKCEPIDDAFIVQVPERKTNFSNVELYILLVLEDASMFLMHKVSYWR